MSQAQECSTGVQHMSELHCFTFDFLQVQHATLALGPGSGACYPVADVPPV